MISQESLVQGLYIFFYITYILYYNNRLKPSHYVLHVQNILVGTPIKNVPALITINTTLNILFQADAPQFLILLFICTKAANAFYFNKILQLYFNMNISNALMPVGTVAALATNRPRSRPHRIIYNICFTLKKSFCINLVVVMTP